jgi:hypothetical protein
VQEEIDVVGGYVLVEGDTKGVWEGGYRDV